MYLEEKPQCSEYVIFFSTIVSQFFLLVKVSRVLKFRWLSKRLTLQASQWWSTSVIWTFPVGSRTPPAPPAFRPWTTTRRTSPSSSGRWRGRCWASVPSYLPSLAPSQMLSCLLGCHLLPGESQLRHSFCCWWRRWRKAPPPHACFRELHGFHSTLGTTHLICSVVASDLLFSLLLLPTQVAWHWLGGGHHHKLILNILSSWSSSNIRRAGSWEGTGLQGWEANLDSCVRDIQSSFTPRRCMALLT